jgi:NAD(P)-dependent dehydrogenase (short-subunit alcohol dehydrogenase family)
MSKRLEDKVAVITGSTSGIGRASAELFAEEGASVVTNGRRRDLGQEVVDGIVAQGGTATYFYADMSRSEDVQALIQHALDTYGRLDILMNNAYSGRSASVLDMEEKDWDAMYAVMLKAPILASKAALPTMIAQGSGVIVNTSSVHGVLAGRENAPYNTFKAALITSPGRWPSITGDTASASTRSARDASSPRPRSSSSKRAPTKYAAKSTPTLSGGRAPCASAPTRRSF